MYEDLVKRLRTHNGWALNKTLDEAADAIEELQDRIAASEATIKRQSNIIQVKDRDLQMAIDAKSQWISVTERLPEIGETVFVLAYGYDAFTAKMLDQTEYGYPVFECSGFFRELAKPGRITHWMPLPVPPKEGEQ